MTSLEGWSSAIELHPQGSWGACPGLPAIRHRVGGAAERIRLSWGERAGIPVSGAVDETRTRDLNLGKVALYQLSYYRMWCLGAELNHRHVDFQSTALPTELPRQIGDPEGARTLDLQRDRLAF